MNDEMKMMAIVLGAIATVILGVSLIVATYSYQNDHMIKEAKTCETAAMLSGTTYDRSLNLLLCRINLEDGK
jgi:hypothetical protein